MVYMSTGYLKEVDSLQQTVELLLLHTWDVLTFGQVYLVTTEVYTECKMINSLQFFFIYTAKDSLELSLPPTMSSVLQLKCFAYFKMCMLQALEFLDACILGVFE